MSTKTGTDQFLVLSENFPVIDVRAPAEFIRGHIPLAHNIPLFDDNERAVVGISYFKEGNENAIHKGFEIAETKIPSFIQKVNRLAQGKKILLYCWRGGMRSASMAWLFETAGYECILLDGGYSTYRKNIRKHLSENVNIVLLGGMTGSGKTDLLQQLKSKGGQVLDLEKLACHKGSVFGSIGESVQASGEQFENNLFREWSAFDKSKIIWIEDESISIGKIFIPCPLWEKMKTSPVILIEKSAGERIAGIIKSYAGIDDKQLYNGIVKLTKRLGNEKTKQAVKALSEKKYNLAAEILLYYYDKTYLHSITERKDRIIARIYVSQNNQDELADIIIKKSREYYSTGIKNR